jgi:CDP-diacylglycerol--glycerol-3-phosphate 3-phosphatidyltransferase
MALNLPMSGGLYGAKPAFRSLLGPAADALARRRMSPDTITFGGVAAAAAGGAALALVGGQPRVALLVPVLAALRIALNALDGMVAERRGVARPWGGVLNEVADRVADVALFGALLLVPESSPALVVAAVVAALLASHVGVLAAAVGGRRVYRGVLGKADRMALLSLAALVAGLTGDLTALRLLPILLAIGALVTAIQRLRIIHAGL